MKQNLLLILFLSMLIWPVTAQIYDDFNSYNTCIFHKADGWTNGEPFNCTWRADCVSFSGGIMSLTINRDSGSPPYMTKLTVNGVVFTNKWASNLPAKINGLYYIVYDGNVGWSHFEAR